MQSNNVLYFFIILLYICYNCNCFPVIIISCCSNPLFFDSARKINLAAMHAMDDCKKRGQAILVFPSGTRYRPGKPETKRGLREIDSYLRLFDVMLLVSINGNCLRINPEAPDNMMMDLIENDTITLSASPVIECKQFRRDVIAGLSETEEDAKQKIVDRVMAILEEQHEAAEAGRK